MDLGGAKRSRSPSAASPGDPLGPFPSLGKDLAPQGETLPLPPQAAKYPSPGTAGATPSPRRAKPCPRRRKRRKSPGPVPQAPKPLCRPRRHPLPPQIPKIDTALPLYYNTRRTGTNSGSGPFPQADAWHRNRIPRTGPGAPTPGPLLWVCTHPPQPETGVLRLFEYSTFPVLSQGGPQKTQGSGRLAICTPRWRERSPGAAFCSVRVPKSWPPSAFGRRPGKERLRDSGQNKGEGGWKWTLERSIPYFRTVM